MEYNLFLDDIRKPVDCLVYSERRGIKSEIYVAKDWVVVKSYSEFVDIIKKCGLPKLISFDHDLADMHYKVDFKDWEDNSSEQLGVEETGYDCAKWLVKYCQVTGLRLPDYIVHSMNPVGRKNIQSLLDNYNKHQE